MEFVVDARLAMAEMLVEAIEAHYAADGAEPRLIAVGM